MTQIIEVKIARRILPPNDEIYTFPFDRIFLTTNLNIISQILKYYLSMPLTDTLFNLLKQVRIIQKHIIDIDRNDNHLNGEIINGEKRKHLFDSITNIKSWSIIVPTKIKYETTKDSLYRIKTLDYLILNTRTKNNKPPKLPPIKLHTPNKKPILVCGKCKNVASMYNAECSLGTYQCIKFNKIIISKDKIR